MTSAALLEALNALYHGQPTVKEQVGALAGCLLPPCLRPRPGTAAARLAASRIAPASAHPAQANKWLEQFQQSAEAWQVTNDILHNASAGMEAHYFCAQTLRTKVGLGCSLFYGSSVRPKPEGGGSGTA